MRLVIFDWDGTLADSTGRILLCFEGAFRRLGRTPPDEAVLRGLIGIGLPQQAEILFPDDDAEFHTGFVSAYRDAWFGEGLQEAQLFAGAREVLEELRAAGHALAVATGKSRKGLDRDLAQTGVADRFVATRCADEGRSKPHPEMLDVLLEVTGRPRETAVMIGDTTHDLEMASAASVRSVAVSYGAMPRERLVAADPGAFIDDIRELPALLAGW